MSKEEKLAAARKKLKEFQNQQKKRVHYSPTPLSSVESTKYDADHRPQSDSQIRETTHPNAIPDTIPLETSASNINDGELLPQLSHYFSDGSKNNFLFDVNPTSNVNSIQTNIPSNGFTLHSTLSDPETTEDSKAAVFDEVLKNELVQAEARIKMQAEALDIITADREDVQLKLSFALKEIEEHQKNEAILRNELHELKEQVKESNQIVSSLRTTNELSLKSSQSFEEIISELKERNEELEQSLKIRTEKNIFNQKQLDETQSQYNMLVLKFQQLGIETSQSTTDYETMCEESNTAKRKYVELEEKYKTLTFEKEHTDTEYRQYIQNLQERLHTTELESQNLSTKNQELVEKISSQTEHIGSLEKMLQKSPIKEHDEELVISLKNEIRVLREELEEAMKEKEVIELQLSESEEWKSKAISLEENLEALKLDMINSKELQMAVESEKVAASQAISQNNKLKIELERLNTTIHLLSEEKQQLQENVQKLEARNRELISSSNQSKTDDSITKIMKNDAAINTDIRNETDESSCGKTNIVAMQQLQEKFKSVLDKMADLTDEKQQLEHLVLQLQSETETIEEYVALYQKQRSILQQRAYETDQKMEQVALEKQRLLNVIHSILTTNIVDSNILRELIQQNLSAKLANELNRYSCAEKNGLTTSNILNDNPNEHGPSCHCCSGKLIVV